MWSFSIAAVVDVGAHFVLSVTTVLSFGCAAEVQFLSIALPSVGCNALLSDVTVIKLLIH